MTAPLRWADLMARVHLVHERRGANTTLTERIILVAPAAFVARPGF